MNSLATETKTQQYRLKFHGDGGDYFGIWLVNAFLSVLTLGIYSAWAKVRTRRYFYGNTELAGDRFDYHARPLQILLGRLVAFVAFVVFYICLFTNSTLSIVLMLVLVALVPWIVIRSWRYEAIMSSYRGVRFNYQCRIGRAYMVFFVWPMLLYVALIAVYALGAALSVATGMKAILIPLCIVLIPGFFAIQGIFSAMTCDLYVNNMFFGDAAFKGEMQKSAFIKFSLTSLLLLLPFLVLFFIFMGSFIYDLYFFSSQGLDEDAVAEMMLPYFGKIMMMYVLVLIWIMVMRAFLVVKQRNYLFNQTTLDSGKITFRSTMKFSTYLGLLVTNGLMVIFSGGLASPFAHVRHARYMLETLEVKGDLDALTMHAHRDSASIAVAEEMVQALDINVGF